MQQKNAIWVRTRVRNASTESLRLALRAGSKGRGRLLGSVVVWADSCKSWEAAGPIMARIEDDAEADGFRVLQDESEG